MEFSSALEDPRIDRSKRHQLLDIITIAICAVIYGAAELDTIVWTGLGQQSFRAGFVGYRTLYAAALETTKIDELPTPSPTSRQLRVGPMCRMV